MKTKLVITSAQDRVLVLSQRNTTLGLGLDLGLSDLVARRIL